MYTIIKSEHKKLLITLGDSWTHGVGNYDPTALENFEDGLIDGNKLYTISAQKDCFYPNAWPTDLSRKLEYDLLNLGQGGDSNSATAKRFICDFDEKNTLDLSKYESITVLWLLSDPFRFSFYSNHRLKSWHASSTDEILKWYIIDVHKTELDGWLETKYSLKSVENYCKNKNFNFLFGSAFTDILPLETIYRNERNIHNRITRKKVSEFLNAKKYWAHCGHPNKEGHLKIAESLYTVLINKHKGII